MKIAYLILAHTNFELLRGACELFTNEESIYFIHIDSKVKEEDFKKLFSNKKIVILNNRLSISRGGRSMVQATINLLLEARKYGNFDRYVLISGDTLPTKSANEIRAYFTRHDGYDIIDISKETAILENRYSAYSLCDFYNRKRAKNIKQKWTPKRVFWSSMQLLMNLLLPRKQLPNERSIYGGSLWWALTHDSVESLLTYIQENKKEVALRKHSLVPDEMFFQTLLVNLKGIDVILDEEIVYTDWVTGPDYPKMLDNSDLHKVNMSNKVFARKFNENGVLNIPFSK